MAEFHNDNTGSDGVGSIIAQRWEHVLGAVAMLDAAIADPQCADQVEARRDWLRMHALLLCATPAASSADIGEKFCSLAVVHTHEGVSRQPLGAHDLGGDPRRSRPPGPHRRGDHCRPRTLGRVAHSPPMASPPAGSRVPRAAFARLDIRGATPLPETTSCPTRTTATRSPIAHLRSVTTPTSRPCSRPPPTTMTRATRNDDRPDAQSRPFPTHIS